MVCRRSRGLGWSRHNGTCSQQKRRGKRPRLATTAAQARANNCDVVATNGGPYNKDGTSSGPLVLKGQLQTNNTQSSFVGIGLAVNQSDIGDVNMNEQFWVLGTYSQVVEAVQFPLWEFVTGFGWLVYNGISVAKNNENPTGAKRAARTAIGLDKDSNMFLLVVDGCERCLNSKKQGLTLEDLAQLLVHDVGAKYAINMDGGGSSTMVRGMKNVVNRPTCLDIPIKCQRPVATVICVSSRITTGTLEAHKEVSFP